MREQNYLRDVFSELLERAREAKTRARVAGEGECTREFEQGRALGYYEVLSTMLHQLDAFGIAREGVGVATDLDIERELA
jgi:hypothetical protein